MKRELMTFIAQVCGHPCSAVAAIEALRSLWLHMEIRDLHR